MNRESKNSFDATWGPAGFAAGNQPCQTAQFSNAGENSSGLFRVGIKVLCLSFKPNTDDLRESAAIELTQLLVAEGAQVQSTIRPRRPAPPRCSVELRSVGILMKRPTAPQRQVWRSSGTSSGKSIWAASVIACTDRFSSTAETFAFLSRIDDSVSLIAASVGPA